MTGERVPMDGAHIAALLDDLARAVDELCDVVERHPEAWTRARQGKWTGAQHTEHVAMALEVTMPPFEHALRQLRDDTISPAPWRGPLQSLFFATIVRPGWLPRVGSAIAPTHPGAAPDRALTERRLREDVDRYRSLAQGLDAAALDRLWIRNPFMTRLRWHYTLPEFVRMSAVHVRHHAAQVRELATTTPVAEPARG